MQELEVAIRFTSPSLGNRFDTATNVFRFQRSLVDDSKLVFMPAWHAANMRFAAQLCGRHHKAVTQIFWHMEIAADFDRTAVFRCYGPQRSGKRARWSAHEFLGAGDTAQIRCVVPETISVEELRELCAAAGQYRGLSPWRPKEYGRYEVLAIEPFRVTEKQKPPDWQGQAAT
jgi:hypothetical protein